MTVATAAAVEIDGLTISYRRRGQALRVISDLSLTIRPGEAYGLVGESGCGKTTVAMAVMRYLPQNAVVESGSIRFAGDDLLGASPETLRRWRGNRMAMVYQDPGTALNPSIRVGHQISEVTGVGGPDLERSAVHNDPGLGRSSPDVDSRRHEPGQRHPAVQYHLVRRQLRSVDRDHRHLVDRELDRVQPARPAFLQVGDRLQDGQIEALGAGPGRWDVGRQQRCAQPAAAPVPPGRDRIGDRRGWPAGQKGPGRPGRPTGHGRAGPSPWICLITGHDSGQCRASASRDSADRRRCPARRRRAAGRAALSCRSGQTATMFTERVYERRRRDADVCLRGIDRRCRSAGHPRRAPFL